jgi:hypothetical protein
MLDCPRFCGWISLVPAFFQKSEIRPSKLQSPMQLTTAKGDTMLQARTKRMLE